MACTGKCGGHVNENNCNSNGNFATYCFIVLILYILLAIILGGSFAY